MQHEIKIFGELELIVKDKNGKIISREKIKNIIVNKGKEALAKLLNGVSTKYFRYIQIGTGTAAPTPSDTALDSFYAEKEALCSYKADFKAVLSVTFTFSEAVVITESGVFNDTKAASPDMLCRQVFTGKSMSEGQSLDIVWSIGVA